MFVTFQPVRRLILAGGFAVAAAIAVTGPADSADRSTVADPCPTNELTQIYFDGCLPSIDPPPAAVSTRGPNQLPEINGIPCDGTDSGTCIGLSEQPSVSVPQPDTSVSQSP